MSSNSKPQGWFSNLVSHLMGSLFITATGAAAFVHTTWAIGTLFSGHQPSVTASLVDAAGAWVAQSWAAVWWLLSPALVAFALDVGQIATSHSIRHDHSTGKYPFAKYATFLVFAFGTYYMQWIYMAHHLPALALGAGVPANSLELVTTIRNLALWFVPALLPLSTLLYTFSDSKRVDSVPVIATAPIVQNAVVVSKDARLPQIAHVEAVAPSDVIQLPLLETQGENLRAKDEDATKSKRVLNVVGERTGEFTGIVQQSEDGSYYGHCPFCSKRFTNEKQRGVQGALNVHGMRFCKANPSSPKYDATYVVSTASEVVDMEANEEG